MNYRKYIAMLKSNKPSRTIFVVSCIALMSTLIGCNVLDTKEDIYDTDEQIKTNYQVLYDFGYAAYTRLQNRFDAIDGNLFAAVSDEAEYTLSPSNTQIFNEGSWNSTNNPDNTYAYNYEGIQAATYFLEKFPNYASFLKQNRNLITQNDINNYNRDVKSIRALRFENRVLRAYFYFELLKRYGGVPLVKTSLSADSNTLLPRNTVDEVVNYIVSEIDASKDSLITNWGRDFDIGLDGRITKGAALALKSRVLLYAASPLYVDFGDTNEANKPTDIAMWKSAADAAKAVIDLNQYELASSYADLFKNDFQNKEYIFVRRYAANSDFEKSNFPVSFGGKGGTNPSQNLVDDYEMLDGTPFDWNDPAKAAQPFENRDARLGATILMNMAPFKGKKVATYPEGADASPNPNATKTGYYLRKFLNEDVNIQTGGSSSGHVVPLFRLAEIYLNYVEALNECDPTNPDIALYLNKVRNRASLPNVSALSQEQMRAVIQHERRVELAFEEHRSWDVRRWKIASSTLGAPLMGVQIERKPLGGYTYMPVKVEQRVFQPKMYWYPIPQSEVLKLKQWKQNNGW